MGESMCGLLIVGYHFQFHHQAALLGIALVILSVRYYEKCLSRSVNRGDPSIELTKGVLTEIVPQVFVELLFAIVSNHL